jgi:hypothetical protein
MLNDMPPGDGVVAKISLPGVEGLVVDADAKLSLSSHSPVSIRLHPFGLPTSLLHGGGKLSPRTANIQELAGGACLGKDPAYPRLKTLLDLLFQVAPIRKSLIVGQKLLKTQAWLQTNQGTSATPGRLKGRFIKGTFHCGEEFEIRSPTSTTRSGHEVARILENPPSRQGEEVGEPSAL